MDQNAYFCEFGRSSDQEVCLRDSLADEAAYSCQSYYNGECQQFYPVVYYLYYPVYATTPYDNSVTYYPVPIYQSMYPTTVFYYGFVYYYPIESLSPYSSPVESEYYSPSSSSVEPSSSDEYEDCFYDVSESFYYTPCNSPELPSSCEEYGGHFYHEQEQSFYADNPVDYIESNSPVGSEHYSPSSSSVESTSRDEYEDCFSDVSESFYHTPCSSSELSLSCEEYGGHFYDEQQQRFCADNTVDYVESCDTFDSNTNGIESLGSVEIEEEPSSDDEDDVAFSTEEAYDASSEYSDSDVEVDGFYQSYSLEDENKSPPPQFLSDFYPHTDERYKKCESRLWFFNAVSKSNCCECYKLGEKSSQSGINKKAIESCAEYKRIKETEEYTNFIKGCIYTSVLKGNVRRNEEYKVHYLPKIDETEEECPEDTAEIIDETSNVDGENVVLKENASELGSAEIEPEHPRKRFKGLKKFFSRLFCCSKKPP